MINMATTAKKTTKTNNSDNKRVKELEAQNDEKAHERADDQ